VPRPQVPALAADRPGPPGAETTPEGVRFTLRSEWAERVELCLFDEAGDETVRLALPGREGPYWHGLLPGAGSGLHYGWRVHGPWRPEEGLRFNPAKLLVDPFAHEVRGGVYWDPALFGHIFEQSEGRQFPSGPLTPDGRNSAPFVPRSVVRAPFETRDRPPRPAHSSSDLLVWEVHVRGATMRHPQVPPEQRGTYLGLSSDPVRRHLERLGVTAVELLPVFPFADETHLVRRGLTNYWGYNPFTFLAPEPRFAAGDPVAEFRAMVDRFHQVGIEVWLDVVYNHTAEGEVLGPTLSLRGIDDLSYYRTDPADPVDYRDWAGTGNALDAASPAVQELVLASLRHWVTEYGVDGFRFDLTSVLARDEEGFREDAPLLEAITSDPVLAGIRLIAEPWDATPEGYALGRFPAPWAEWNDRYRDAVRRFWRGDGGAAAGLATALGGSQDRFSARSAHASLNFAAVHDGFPLRDVVTYQERHNQANGEENLDGNPHEVSWNHGVEGPTADPGVRAVRRRQVRNLLATLLLSKGVPMLAAGDELGRTQGGNNNAYCHDDGTTWLEWSFAEDEEADPDLSDLVTRLAGLRRERGDLRGSEFYTGRPAEKNVEERPDIRWLRADGEEMTPVDWEEQAPRPFAFLLGAPPPLLVLLNPTPEPVTFTLPDEDAVVGPGVWRVWLDTADETTSDSSRRDRGGEQMMRQGNEESITLLPHHLVVLQQESGR
jgi:isoamylase